MEPGVRKAPPLIRTNPALFCRSSDSRKVKSPMFFVVMICCLLFDKMLMGFLNARFNACNSPTVFTAEWTLSRRLHTWHDSAEWMCMRFHA